MSKVYGYARVSTRKQVLDRQIKNILQVAPNADIYGENYTGRTMSRPEWQKLMKRVKAGDTIIFDSVSRMSRTADEGWETYKELFDMGINLEFLNEPFCNTEVYREAAEKQVSVVATGDEDADELISSIATAVSKYMFRLAEKQVKLCFAEAQKEVDDLSKRTSDGMRANGSGHKIAEANTGKTYNSKAAATTKEAILKYSKDFNGSLNDIDVIKLAGCSRNTYYKYKAQLKTEA